MKRHKPKPNPWRGAFAEIDSRKGLPEPEREPMTADKMLETICREIYGKTAEEMTAEEIADLQGRLDRIEVRA